MPPDEASRIRAHAQLILIISTDSDLRERLYDMLQRHAFQTLTVSTGELAVEMLSHRRADLILADSLASSSGGWGLADRIRRFDAQVPIILLCHDDAEAPDQRTLSDIQALLSIQASDDAIVTAIRRWLPSSRTAHPINYPGTILVVDDEPELVRYLSEFLIRRGCDVVTAASGEEALEQAARHHPELAILDVKLTGMDGLITLKKLRAKSPTLKVIMASAVEDEIPKIEAFALGACEYLTKPYDLSRLENLLQQLRRLSRP